MLTSSSSTVPPIIRTASNPDDLTNLFSRFSFNNNEPSAMHVDHGGEQQPLDHNKGLNVKENEELKKNAKKELKEWFNKMSRECCCCLPCGHIFGLSCINKWIQLRKMQAKCPQCNVKIGPSGVTKLYASPVVLVEEEDQQKKDEVSKAKDLKKGEIEFARTELRLLKRSGRIAKTLLFVWEVSHYDYVSGTVLHIRCHQFHPPRDEESVPVTEKENRRLTKIRCYELPKTSKPLLISKNLIILCKPGSMTKDTAETTEFGQQVWI
ncbi:E3 ubiquitin protein ligase RFWD3 [Tanacetum coccineum]|uniref:E3 ubiquitin protein ligase RFWD3 n=1 Tax=Tanacetum coccineum TaxID=301880 RepID=A0ABQ5DKG5_9ASTR